MRLFISIDLPESLSESIALIQEELRDIPSLSLTDPDQAHLTLKFLGSTDGERLDDISSALTTAVTTANQRPFKATFGGFGAFPNQEYIRVVWLGVTSGSGRITTLHDAVERETTAIGFDPDRHEFTPHVTLARMHSGRGKSQIHRFIDQPATPIGSMQVTHITLKESTTTDTGPTYSTVARFPLPP